jgi:hypothetical protein
MDLINELQIGTITRLVSIRLYNSSSSGRGRGREAAAPVAREVLQNKVYLCLPTFKDIRMSM